MTYTPESYLINFIKARPAINKSKFCAELNFDLVDFNKILINKRKIPAARRGTFYRTMRKYGQKFDFDTETALCYYPV